MASHLPRPQDVTSKILSTMDEATSKTLTASLASEWIKELDESLRDTKEQIHDRIQSSFPEFQRQLETSVSVQTRLRTLTSQVDSLDRSLADLIPSVIDALQTHSTLAQTTLNAQIRHQALRHISHCRDAFTSLTTLVQNGDLPEAVGACKEMERLLEDAPEAVKRAQVCADLQRRFQASKARIEEQLGDAYSRCVLVNQLELSIAPSAQVRQSNRTLSLPDILSSLSPTSLNNHLSTLRRDVTSYYIHGLLTQPMAVEQDEVKLTFFPSPPTTSLQTRIKNLSQTIHFLHTHFFVHLPVEVSFSKSLCTPISSSLLTNLLIPNLSSSFGALPEFMELLKLAQEFEEECVVRLLSGDDRPIKSWADGVGGHYERQRRERILDMCRGMILHTGGWAETVKVQVQSQAPPEPAVVLVQEEEPGNDDADAGDAWDLDESLDDSTETDAEPQIKVDDSSWGFDESEPDTAIDDNWGFDDDTETNGHDEPVPEETNGHDDETNWDDPWNDPPSSAPAPPSPPEIKSPKAATRLEKLANKGKKSLDASSSSPMHSPSLTESPNVNNTSSTTTSLRVNVNPPPKAKEEKETYLVSSRTNDILSLVKETMRESREFAESPLASTLVSSSSSSTAGSTLNLTCASILDLYRALYPVLQLNSDSIENGGPIKFSNDCAYLAGEIGELLVSGSELGSGPEAVNKRLRECVAALKVLSDSWFEDAIETHRQQIDTIITSLTLSPSGSSYPSSFSHTTSQDRYDQCETALSLVLKYIRSLSKLYKPPTGILTKTRYYTALGSVTNTALTRVITEILELGDITEEESHRLGELCRIFGALEGLFVEDPEQPSFIVAYVPSWLKFSYLGELLEASLADITYLFSEGALVDFDVEELARLVRALFADTPLRASTIAKIMSGHPGSGGSS
ncbi:hypothetical protein BT96DRAFT_889918 [Gymnopus androsaceus JB14]|uniref:ZW10 C-terminal helical domain-containing protein n=1 Tax=Gymnopus androsaceus JB14 TaxID=1447944 RepID=A0A6A4GWN4_9AGAR|nr:hypothetical protein BT96DRAFT_889918 [Gymnopus androsaceus JB14]